ncbi:alpha/beta hydrolase family protein [Paenibacillus sp. EC2-1]|uniref:alpha/beta hydrolase family protein n=1 Tax=Paenibacillus sp. EC2-1 TaxID=3388665 RepID=UPI003BEF1BBC
MIGRIIRVSEQNPRLVISIFYPSSGGSRLKGIDLYAPCQTEVADIFKEMGVDLENLNVIDKLSIDDKPNTSKGIWPVLILSPGFGVERDMYLGIISNLVPKGYIVVTIGTPYESIFTVYPDGSLIKQEKEMAELKSSDYSSWHQLLDSRSRSITEVMEYLDTLNQSAPELAGLFDLKNVAAVGHSLGGAAVLEAATLVKRIKAVILLDPSFHLIRVDEIPSSVPVLLLRQEASSYEAMASVMNEEIARDYIDGQRNAYNILTNSHFYRVKGAQHMSFSDIPLYYGDLHAESVHTATVEAMTAFMEAVFQSRHRLSAMPLHSNDTVVQINSDGDPI